MQPGIIFALLSLISAGLNDFVFKMYSRKSRSRGMYIFGVGIVWTLLQFVTFSTGDHAHSLNSVSISYGFVCGMFLVLSNIFLLESLTHIDISLCSTIYRLNTVGVVVLSFLILNEPMGLIKISGISLGIAAVIILFQKPIDSKDAKRFLLFFGLAVIASALRALYGITSKLALNNSADPQVLLIIISFSWIIGGGIYAKLKERRFRITGKKALYSGISGVLVFMIVNFLMSAVKYGEASVVIPIANMSFIIALGISSIIGMEKMTTRKLIAVIVAVASIVSLSIS